MPREVSLCRPYSSGPTDEHLADVVAAEQAREGVGYVLDALEDRLAVARACRRAITALPRQKS